MYPYHLGCHLKTGRLCRIPHSKLGVGIPVGFAKIIRYKQKHHTHISSHYTTPYNYFDGPVKGELLVHYWSLPRWTDIQHELGEPLTGPIMFQTLGPIQEVEGY